MRRAVLLGVALVTAACSARPGGPSSARLERPVSFIDAAAVVPGLVVEMRYFGSDNFVGRPIEGYDAPVCLLTREAAGALARVQAELAPFTLGLKVFDCYRPVRAVAHFARWARDPADTLRRSDYYPDIDKARLFELGYIAERSGHSRGSTVDLTVIDLATGEELDMGTDWDLFSTLSWPHEQALEPAQRAHRMLLHTLMVEYGFRPLEQEWWHFTLADEPYPETWFDFPIARP